MASRRGSLSVGLIVTVLLVGQSSQSETIKLLPIADVDVSSHQGETDVSMGKTPKLRLKNIENLVLLNFDFRPLRGKRVKSLWLHMRTDPESAQRDFARLKLPASFVDPLRNIGVSTVSSAWVEGAEAVPFRPDSQGHGATFAEASFGQKPWAWKGSTLADVIFGNGGSVHSHAALVREGDMWWKVAVDPAVIETLVASGSGGGLCVMDESSVSGGLSANTRVFSRESGSWSPYLTVETEEVDAEPPAAPTDLSVAPAAEKAGLDSGAVRVQLRVGQVGNLSYNGVAARVPNVGQVANLPYNDVAAYRLYIDGRAVEPWQVAKPGRFGEQQTFYLTDLPPRLKFRLEIEAADAAGNVSPRVGVEAMASPSLPAPPELPGGPARQVANLSDTEPPVRFGLLRVWAFPELGKVDPMTGEQMDEPDSATYRALAGRPGGPFYRQRNAVWDSTANAIRLVSARGEIVGFQVAVERAGALLKGVRIVLGPLRGAAEELGVEQIRAWRAWYVQSGNRWHAELALPLEKLFDIPTADNGIVGQRNQTVWFDIAVPTRAHAGTYQANLQIEAEGAAPVRIPVTLEVLDVAIPETLNFWGELNCYGPPGPPGSDYFYEAHRLAHYHRCAINSVPYSQGGDVYNGYAPKLAGEGADLRVADWTMFDRNLGPLLDGSAFAKNPRAGVPVQVLYLPMFENWPVAMTNHYAYKGRPGEATIVLHHLLAPPVEKAFDEAYRRGWVNVAREFVRHFEEKGWDRTLAEFYLNNKWQFGGTSWWLLDEPVSRDDFLALQFFGRMWREATREARTARMLFRGDISRPQWQGDLLDGLVQIEYDNGELFQRERTDRVLAERMPAIWCTYGACNRVGESNLQTAAWCLRAYVAGADAVLPWNSLDNGGRSLREANQNGLIVNGRSLGYGPVASFRVFALRRGAQDVEILRLLAERRRWNREQIGLLVTQRVPLSARFKQGFLDEAAAARFANLTSRGFVELKEGALRMLAGE